MLLAINLVVEIAGQWVVNKYGSNLTMFIFYMAFLLTAHMFLLREMIVGRVAKRIVLYVLWIYPLICLVNMFFVQGMHRWQSYSYCIGNILIVGLSIYYFYELFKRPRAINLVREPAFWICSGLLFYYMVSFPFLSLMNFVTYAPRIITNNFSSILTVLNILQYILFAIAFLCRLKLPKPIFGKKMADNAQ